MEKNVINMTRVLLSMQRLSWEHGVSAQAMFESGQTEVALLMANEAIHRQTEAGLLGLCDMEQDGIDCGANGIPLWYAYCCTGEKRYLEAFQKMADWFLKAPKSKAGIVYHNPNWRRTMIDGVYHMVPMMILAGYKDFAMEQIRLFRRIHRDPKSGLYSQWWDDDLDDFIRRDFWGPGMGWMSGALALSAVFLQEGRERREIEEYLKELIDAVCIWVLEDGLFHNVINDPQSFPETSTPLMLAYSIYRAIQNGSLPASYLPAADKMFYGARLFIDDQGYVRNACASPHFDCPGIAAEAQSFAVMCYSVRQDIEEGNPHFKERRRKFESINYGSA